MPTLRLIYLTDQQYADMTEDERNNTTTAAAEFPTTIKHIHDEQSRFPIDDATRNAAVGGEKMALLLQAAIDEVNSRSFGSHAIRHQHEESENDSTSSVHLDAIQQTSGNKRKRTAPQKSFDDRFNDLMSFKAKYGHCNVSQHGKDASLGKWCDNMRVSYTNIKNNQKPETKLSDEQIQRLSDAGFKWFLRGFDDHFNDLMAFKAGFKWCLQQKERELSLIKAFYDHFNDLMAFKAKYGHCDVSTRGEDASLGRWCSVVRGSYKKIQNNQNPKMKLSDEQIQRLNDAGFKWCL
jgi:hypothetical protein